MSKNYANSSLDGRLRRNREMSLQKYQSTIQRLRTQYEQRPDAKYDVGDSVLTPEGIKTIDRRAHSHSSGWHYWFIEGDYPHRRHIMCNEDELRPISEVSPIEFLFDVGETIMLPSGIERTIIAANISQSGEIIYGFQITDKQTTYYTEAELLAIHTRFAIGDNVNIPFGQRTRTIINRAKRESGIYYCVNISTGTNIMPKWYHINQISN